MQCCAVCQALRVSLCVGATSEPTARSLPRMGCELKSAMPRSDSRQKLVLAGRWLWGSAEAFRGKVSDLRKPAGGSGDPPARAGGAGEGLPVAAQGRPIYIVMITVMIGN